MAQLIIQGATSAIAGAVSSIPSLISSTLINAGTNYAVSAVSNILFKNKKVTGTAPSLEKISIQSSSEGNSIYQIFGKARITGQIIWASRFSERSVVSGGGKNQAKTESKSYFASFAIGLCEGVSEHITKCWIDGNVKSLSSFTTRFYKGTNGQIPDQLIVNIEGEGNVPAFRGLSYIVFEQFPISEFGNRIPTFSFEVSKSLNSNSHSQTSYPAVVLLPGSGEFSLATDLCAKRIDDATYISENVHSGQEISNLAFSLDQLKVKQPQCKNIALIVSWFGDNYDAQSCKVRPCVENNLKETVPLDWQVGGLTRPKANTVSQTKIIKEGQEVTVPVYGGTPSDNSLRQSLREMKTRGLRTLFYPFLLMDTNNFGWRGEITPSGDKEQAIKRFFGDAKPGDFSLDGEVINFNGNDKYSWSHMILHYAYLCASEGGVDSFLIGSEFRGLTSSHKGNFFPAIIELKKLAGKVRTILGTQTKISYGADWSEYRNIVDGNNVYFHFDPLWADNNIDFIAIDNYLPISDWRGGATHMDKGLAKSIYDQEYLVSQINGGEYYDYYYKNSSDRQKQIRTSITDGAYNEAWIYRAKDFKSFWLNPHFNRLNGIRQSQPTQWQAKSKPIWFTELGCPAIDKGSNQPNVFIDKKSHLSNVPYFSNGQRDDRMQQVFINTHLKYWQESKNNPLSDQYNGNMIAQDRIYIYSWDARPFPYFPAYADIWSDAVNWYRGHWITGRSNSGSLADLIIELCHKIGVYNIDTSQIDDDINGYLIDRTLSVRSLLETLAALYQIDFIQSGDKLKAVKKNNNPITDISVDDMIYEGDNLFLIDKKQIEDFPNGISIAHIDEAKDYSVCVTNYISSLAVGKGQDMYSFPIVISPAEVFTRARLIYHDAIMANEVINFSLPNSYLALEPADIIKFTYNDNNYFYKIETIKDDIYRKITAYRVVNDDGSLRMPSDNYEFSIPSHIAIYQKPKLIVLDIPIIDNEILFASYSLPWPGSMQIGQEIDGFNWKPLLTHENLNIMGRLTAQFNYGKSGLIDYGNHIYIKLSVGELRSLPDLLFFDYGNLCAIEVANGEWEIMQFMQAELMADGTYKLTKLLRGLFGTEAQAMQGAKVGANFVLINTSLSKTKLDNNYIGASINFSATAFNKDFDEGRIIQLSYKASSLIPLSPVHIKMTKLVDGYLVTWIRRDRGKADQWLAGDIAMSEVQEEYNIEIFQNDHLLKKLSCKENKIIIAKEIITSNSGTYKLLISQNSNIIGTGTKAEFLLIS